MAIRTAIIGYGRSGSTMHADTISLISSFKVTAICDLDDDALNRGGMRFGCNLYKDYREMLKREKLDLAVIVTQSHLHCPMACDCLKVGVNVLVTKPWALNEFEARKMIDEAQRTKSLLLPWLPARTAPDLLKLKDIVGRGLIGNVFQIRRSEYSFGLRCDWQTKKEFGGGYLLNWGPHLVDQPLELAGSPVKSAYGKMRNINNPGDGEDMFYGVMETENGIIVTSEWNIAAGNLPNWVVQGDRGTAIITGNTLELHGAHIPRVLDERAYRAEIKISTTQEELIVVNDKGINIKYGDSFLIYERVAKAIRGEEEYPVSTQSALNLTVVLDMIRKSAMEGKTVYFGNTVE